MSDENNNNIVVPFLKWAGGKRWLVTSYPSLFPSTYKRYIEPFLGSGAVFFHLRPKYSLISDNNPRLIDAYQAIKENWKLVESQLLVHHSNHSKQYYYAVRCKKYQCFYKRAAQLIYLNRTCWNGLYRVNLKGQFNVPIGTKNQVVLPTDDLLSTSKLLHSAQIVKADFEESIYQAKGGDLLFVDPPYTVKHNHNGFIKYNEELFSWEDQIRLRDALEDAADRGVKIVACNANHSSVAALYKEHFFVSEVIRPSVIAASSRYRGQYGELLITRNL